MVIVLMGAAGAGKTTVGRQLSEELRWPFLDGDEVHPLENITQNGSRQRHSRMRTAVRGSRH